MFKKLVYFLCISFMFLSCGVKANAAYIPNIVMINGLPMYETPADRVIGDAKRKSIEILNMENNIIVTDIDTKTEGLSITIKSELMDCVACLYRKASEDRASLSCNVLKGEERKKSGIALFCVKRHEDSLVEGGIVDTLIMIDKNDEVDLPDIGIDLG